MPDLDTVPMDTVPRHTLEAIMRLSYRDKQIIELLTQGLQNDEIGKELNFSGRTIKVCIHKMCQNLDVRNRTHLVAFAFRHGIINL